ncbi:hypothetical protein [Streptomyces sp. MBT33]|uniref:hypothetical protein n=1 Tax=Streptomyces sp. MBT33 TaxID=1488363 RepID=UPI00190958E4|nr:hypothetical protein [Streptomyces sp. MBT33]MBK3642440.1 hypothetical protein [Streptomyces sp. MBT33]
MALKKFALFIVAGAALATGCSTQSHAQPHDRAGSQTEPPVRSIRTVQTDRLQVMRPLDKYAPDDEADTLMKRAEAVVVNRCLRRLGYHRHPLDEQAESNPDPNIYEFYWFPQAGHAGYSTPSQASEDDNWDSSASEVEKKLLTGKLATYQGHRVPKDGCYGEAGRTLIKGAQPPSKFSEQGITITRVADASPRGLIESYISVIRQALSMPLAKDSRIDRVVSEWSSCMKAVGYRYASPTDAATDKRWHNSSGKVSKAEITTATDDMACKKRVRYLDEVIAVESAYENQYISRHPAQMKEFLELSRRWRANAQRIVN